MPRRRIRAHYKQLSEFERGCIIGLKEAGWANRKNTRHMGRSDAAIRRCWQEWVDNLPWTYFQQHNTRPHTARVTMNCLTACQTFFLDQPDCQISIQSSMPEICREGDCVYRGMFIFWPDNWSKFGNKYRRRPSGCLITLCHVVWQFASRLEFGQHLIELVTL
ncbi:HTH_Tnp_Tc3_2 domain-containing protein [Trichonephila clavipes]|nr:HTH_Tnp_Tc3_2 domain-containing protein [Trichonephila clavipes]